MLSSKLEWAANGRKNDESEAHHMPRFRTKISRVSVSIWVAANRSSGRNLSLTRSKAAVATSIAASAESRSG